MKRWVLLLVFVLAACGEEAVRNENDIQVGDPLYTIDFEDETAFETGNFSDRESNRPFDADLKIEGGVYHIQYTTSSSAYIWGQGGEAAQDVDIEVDARFISGGSEDFYGVMCRVDDSGAGYAFLVGRDGYGAIARADGRSLSFLVEWREHEAIKKHEATNKIRAVCVGDYFALYVNEKFVADVEDDDEASYLESGQVGFIAGVLTESREESQVNVDFDNLIVREASVK